MVKNRILNSANKQKYVLDMPRRWVYVKRRIGCTSGKMSVWL